MNDQRKSKLPDKIPEAETESQPVQETLRLAQKSGPAIPTQPISPTPEPTALPTINIELTKPEPTAPPAPTPLPKPKIPAQPSELPAAPPMAAKAKPIEEQPLSTESIAPSGESTIAKPKSRSQPQTIVKEIIKKAKPRPAPSRTSVGVPQKLTQSDKEEIFRDKLKELSAKGNLKRTQIHQANLQKILDYLDKHQFIANKDVEALCGVASATAWKLLEELQRQAKIVQIGLRGAKVKYKLS